MAFRLSYKQFRSFSKEVAMFHEFFAVTKTSVYHVTDKFVDGWPYVAKIALKGQSQFPVGRRLIGGSMVGICRWLMVYVPEGGGFTSFQRKIEMVNSAWFGDSTSDIVALFLKKEDAMNCFEAEDLKLCDERWLESTRAVIDAIGNDHPVFEVCKYPGLRLLP